MKTNTKSLRCCCCDASTRGRQWWNRDNGYGLCEQCAESLPKRGTTPEEMRRNYGVRGVHYCVGTERAHA